MIVGKSQQCIPIPPVPRAKACTLSFAQERMWFFDQLEPYSAVYNISSALRLTGLLDVPALQKSLDEIVRRHEVLRVTFVFEEGHPLQVLHPAKGMEIVRVDLGVKPEADRKAETMKFLSQEAREPFELSRGPLLRAMLLRLSDREHILQITFHHIVCDGWSIAVFDQELSAFYEVFSSGRSSCLPALPIQYTDYAIWQREWLKGEALETQMSYWRKRLEGASPVLELPTDRPRPPVQSYRGATMSFELPRDLTESLKALSRRERVTIYMTLLAAFKTLLLRYTNSEDIVIGTPIASRTRDELEGLIGCFANTLVLRTDLSGMPTFRELLGRVRETVLGAYDHQDLPFEKLVEELQPERTLSHSPLFQVIFALQSAPRGLRLRGLTTKVINICTETAKFDLALSMVEEEGGLKGSFAYSTDLFEGETIQRMAGHFETILNGIVANPDQRIYELPILTKEERHKILVEWNDSEAEYPRDKCIHELFEEQVERSPRAIAVVFDDKEMTYRELNDRADQLARYLRTLGVGPETMVGICAERSMEMVVGLLGVLKAGGAYVPLDPKYPMERLEFMIEDTAVPVILTQRHLVGMMPKTSAKVACLDADPEVFAGGDERSPATTVNPADIAYVVYTSGSTGRPKGVMISHRALCNHMVWMQEAFPLVSADKVLQKTLFTFDASVWEFFAPLLAGATLIVAGPEGHRDSVLLTETVKKHQVTVLQVVPSLLGILIEENAIDQCRSLKRVFCGGDVLPVRLSERFLMSTNADLINLYGPTEACIDTTFRIVPRRQRNDIASIGRPVANTKTYILDRFLQPVPTGVPGELCISGDGLARGYLNRPELTAEKFIPNPFSEEPGARLYMTGDLARYLADGNIEFLGRLDHQVKIRGYRIECDEIEHWLREHPDIHDVVVMAAEMGRGDKELTAYIVSRKGLSVSELRKYLGEYLPDYMIPSAFVFLDKLPLTSNGKIDSRALPAPVFFEESSREKFVPPGNPEEEMIATIWAELLKVERVGLHDNFFALGGHSLLATQVVSRIANASHVNISLRSFFEAPTVSGLAELIQGVRHVKGREYGSDKAGYETGKV